MNTSEKTLADIAFLAENHAPAVLETLPLNLVETHADDLLDIVRLCQDKLTAACYFEKTRDSPDPARKVQDIAAMLRENNEKFGITFAERYFFTSILQDNLKNLDPAYNASKPVAVLIHTIHDPSAVEGAFATINYQWQLEELRTKNKLFVFEVGTCSAALAAIAKIGSKFGPISTLIFGGHGTQKALNLGATTNHPEDQMEYYEHEPDSYLSVLHESRLRDHATHLSLDAVIGLISCSTGKGKEGADNLANSVARALPGRTVYAPTEVTKTSWLYFGFDGGRIHIQFRLLDITYTVKTNPTH